MRITWNILLAIAVALVVGANVSQGAERPNILWLTAEDLSPDLGCYGDNYANTPNLDRFAQRSLRYRRAWSTAPVCAPARTAIITGIYPTATGSQHMRSHVRLPASLRMFPQLLRGAGYYCSNNQKEDYNLVKPPGVWDESSRQAHWKKRAPGQPFFAVFNFEITHESKLRQRPHTPVHDPARAPLPAYHPDTPEVRRDWAQYYDNITTLDSLVAERLQELATAGLAENTIVFFFGDHGSGMPRSKRWLYNSGLQVPFLVHIPEKWRHLAPKDYQPGGFTDRLINFTDLAPTLCSLAGLRPPSWMQGRAFLGRFNARPHAFNHGIRDRMDERYDLLRSVTDGRYVYIRNYLPHLIYGQYLDYMFQTPTTRVWKKLYDEGRLQPPRTFFWERKPVEELYDLESDPDEVRNLAASPAHQKILRTLRKANREELLRVRDVGFAPEAEMHRRSQASTPYEFGQSSSFPFKRILATAELASGLDDSAVPRLRDALGDRDSIVRYWAALGIVMRGSNAFVSCRTKLAGLLRDPSPSVQIAAARLFATYGDATSSKSALDQLVSLADARKNDYFVCIEALNAIDSVGARARHAQPAIESLPRQAPVEKKLQEYLPRLLESINASLAK